MLARLNNKFKKPVFMGILNVTPDSFSDSGKHFQIDKAIEHAKNLISQGADIIDIGGESTRPSAKPISEEEELKRVIPVVEALRAISLCNFIISIDTYKSKVAKAALDAGANIINDVSGLTVDPNMLSVVRDANCPIVIMHNNGIPATKPTSKQHCTGRSSTCPAKVLQTIYPWLETQTNFAISNGIKKENIIIDPGIGFGKTPEEDLYLVENLHELKPLGFPVLVGLSRKSFIKKLFGEENLESKSKELIELAIKNGASIVRVHDVLEFY